MKNKSRPARHVNKNKTKAQALAAMLLYIFRDFVRNRSSQRLLIAPSSLLPICNNNPNSNAPSHSNPNINHKLRTNFNHSVNHPLSNFIPKTSIVANFNPNSDIILVNYIWGVIIDKIQYILGIVVQAALCKTFQYNHTTLLLELAVYIQLSKQC